MSVKIIFFIQTNCGGAERMSITIAKALDPSRYEILFYVIGEDYGTIRNFIPNEFEVKLLKASNFRDSLMKKMYRILKVEKPQIVFASLFPINTRLCFISYLFPKIKVIIRSDNYLHILSLTQKLRGFLSFRRANRIILQTTEMEEEFSHVLKLDAAKLITLSNPVDQVAITEKISSNINPYHSAFHNYVFVGRLSKVKGLDILIDAFVLVAEKDKNARLYIIGETGGIHKAFYLTLLAKVRDYNLADCVFFEGFSNNPYLHMKYATTLVLPSRNEGLPNVVLEALYLETPVVVSDCIPVMKRLVQHAENGYVVAVGDVPALAEAMQLATVLGKVKFTYQSATQKDFQDLFQYNS